MRAKTRRDFDLSAATIQTEIDVLSELEKTLRAELDRLKNEVAAIGQDSVELEFLRKEMAQAESVYNRALAELTSIRVEMQAPSRVTVLQRAAVSETKRTKR